MFTSLFLAGATYGVVSSSHLLSMLGEGNLAVSEEGLLTVSHWLGWVLTCLSMFSNIMSLSQHVPSTVVACNTCDAMQLRTLYAQLTNQLWPNFTEQGQLILTAVLGHCQQQWIVKISCVTLQLD